MNLRDDMTNRELLDLMIEHGLVKPANGLTVNQIFNLTLKVCRRLNIELNVEQKFFLMNDADIVQCEATAGAGKTTMTLLKLLLAIALKGVSPRTMCVVTYTTSSVDDIKHKIRNMMYKVNLALSENGLEISELPNIRSLNSLSYNIVKQFQHLFDIYNPTIASKSEQATFMSRVLNRHKSSGEIKVITDSLVDDLLSLYDYLNERMLTASEISTDVVVTKVDLPVTIIERVLHEYSLDIKLKDKVHHSDCTRMIVELYRKHKEASGESQFVKFLDGLYSYIVVDEFQDVSESMYQLTLILAKGKKFIAIGDGDQSIYVFRGARSNNCERFAKEFDNSSMCLMTYNRRCGQNIIDYASESLELVSERIPKSIKGINSGGSVEVVEYSDKVAVLENLAKELSTRPIKELSNVCIGYRKNLSCYYITNVFTEYGIPFRVKEDYMVGSDQLSIVLDTVLDLLKNCKSIKRISEHLYKVCGVAKVQKYEDKKDVTEDFYDDLFDDEDIDYLYEIPVEKVKLRARKEVVEEELLILEQLCKDLRKGKSVGSVVERLMPLLKKNYWDYYADAIGFPLDLEKLVLRKYNTELSYIEFRNDRTKKEDLIKKLVSQGKGVQLSTFHSLKGLEFDEVHLVELAGDTFPSIVVTEYMTEADMVKEIDSELRLFYVACTRAKHKLVTYWDVNNISAFYEINDNYRSKLASNKLESIQSDTLPTDNLNLTLDFDMCIPNEVTLIDNLDNLEMTLDFRESDNTITEESDDDSCDVSLVDLAELGSLSLSLDFEDIQPQVIESKTNQEEDKQTQQKYDEVVSAEDKIDLVDQVCDSEPDKIYNKSLSVQDTIEKSKMLAEEALKRSIGSRDIYKEDLPDDIALSSDELYSDEYKDIGNGDSVLDNIIDIICRGVDV